MTRLALCLLVIFVAALPASVRAQTLDTASSEDVAIAFYKIAGLTPSFSAWAKDTKLYHDTPLARRPAIAAQEAERLKKAYTDYSPARDILNLATLAHVTLQETTAASPDQKQYTLSWTFMEDNGNFFPYEYRGMLFALVPQKVEDYENDTLTKDQYDRLKTALGNGKDARIILQLRGQYANPAEPMTLYDREVWPLAGMIAGVTLWGSDGALLWEKTANGYVSPQTQSLNALHEKPKAP